MLDLSIIVVNWNSQDLLRKCLEHVRRTAHQISYEIIVVDNASSDGSQAMVRYEFPDVQLIENSENTGFAKANNQGIAISQGRYVLLLNSDAFVEDSTLGRMVEFMDQHPEAGMAGCKLLYKDGRLQPSCSRFPTLASELYAATGLEKLFPKSQTFGQHLMLHWDYDDVREVDVVMGAFMLVRRQVIDEVGGMDERYFMYSEEVDWCFRIKQQGWKILFNPDAQAIHLWGGTAGRVSSLMHVQMYRSKVQYFRKNHGVLSAILLKILIGLGCVLRLGPDVIQHLARRNQATRLESQWRLLLALPGL